MSGEERKVHLIILLGLLPAGLLFATLWGYEALVDGMKGNLHQQRALALRNLTGEPASGSTRPFSWAVVPPQARDFSVKSADWPENFDPEMLLRFRSSLGSASEHGIEVDHGASGPAFLWIVDHDGELRAGLQSRRNFLARLESLRVLVWISGILLAGGAFVVFVTMARKLSDVFNEMETKNLELERANRNLEELGTLKSNFLALVSHELRTPLARLSGHIQLLQKNRKELSSDTIQRFDEMAIEINELGRMTKNVLDLTRLQSEDLSARLGLGQIGQLVVAASERVKSSAKLRGIQVIVDAPETPAVNHDPYLLERILDNLLVNAVKYSIDNGKIIVRIVEADSHVQIRVESSGRIIPETEREKIFEKFHRLSTNDPEIPGTGLGLYLVRQFILMMGGRAWVEALEDGNRFTVTLPLG